MSNVIFSGLGYVFCILAFSGVATFQSHLASWGLSIKSPVFGISMLVLLWLFFYFIGRIIKLVFELDRKTGDGGADPSISSLPLGISGGRSKLALARETCEVDRNRAYSIIVDGKVIGTIDDGRSVLLPVSSGLHDVKLTIDWCGSNNLLIDFGPGAEVSLLCGSSGQFGRIPRAMFFVFFVWNRYIWLRLNQTAAVAATTSQSGRASAEP